LLAVATSASSSLALTDPGQHPGRPEPLLVQVEVLQHGLHERHLIGAVVDREAPREADGLAVAPQDPRADGVESADRRLARALLPDEPGDALRISLAALFVNVTATICHGL
jgi:hypothetical protein